MYRSNPITMLRLPIVILFLALLFHISCKNDSVAPGTSGIVPKTDTLVYEPVSREGALTYLVTSGTVQWQGRKATGDVQEGTIDVTSGELLVNKGRLLSGKINIDMHTLTVTSVKDGGERRDLESHLKDVDFFEVNKFPGAEFSFEEVLPSNSNDFNQVIVGDLTIKGKTNSVNVPVSLNISGDELKAQSPGFAINRTKWGITFRSGLLGTLKEKLIEDTVLISIKLTAKQK